MIAAKPANKSAAQPFIAVNPADVFIVIVVATIIFIVHVNVQHAHQGPEDAPYGLASNTIIVIIVFLLQTLCSLHLAHRSLTCYRFASVCSLHHPLLLGRKICSKKRSS